MKIISIVFKKEIMDMFRDRKTIIMSILIPMIMLPLIYGFMGKGMSKEIEEVNKKLKIAVIKEGESKLSGYLDGIDTVEVIEVDDYNKAIDSGKIDTAIIIPKDFDETVKSAQEMNIQLVYDPASSKSRMTMDALNGLVKSFSDNIVKMRLKEKDIDISILTPFNVQQTFMKVETNGETAGRGRLMLAMLLPMLLVMYAASSPLGSAVDLAAGEKERGTLEPLLTTKANRTSLLWGKLFAITVMGMITVVASLAGLVIALKQNPVLFGAEAGKLALDTKSLLFIAILTILLTMVFAAVELAISMYARSFKEAQTYLAPVTIISMLIGFSSYAINVKSLTNTHFFIPVYNVALCLKEIALGRLSMLHFWTTTGVMAVVVIASIVFARIMFNKEKVIFRT